MARAGETTVLASKINQLQINDAAHRTPPHYRRTSKTNGLAIPDLAQNL